MTTESKFQDLPLKDIVPSPTNPRKTFDQAKTLELATSIQQKGVLQPILVRSKGKKYEIVCGERRYRASKMVQETYTERTTIPAIIKELSDQEVREMQLIENFQREDVHPMEEAVAIKYAIETGAYTVEDLMLKVGKSSTYIKQRMKLNSLTEPWQQLFFNNRISISLAIHIAMFAPDVQLQILADRVDEDELESKSGRMIELNKYQLAAYRGKLSEASFDVKDAALLPAIGACTNCQYNTGNSGLFPEDESAARCANIKCFVEKEDTHFANELASAKEIPGIIFVSTYYGRVENAVLHKQLVDEGFDVYDRNAFSIYDAPEPLNWEDYKEENDYEEMTDSDKEELRQDFEKELADFENDLYSYQRAIESGKYKKAYVIEGGSKGKYIYITLDAKKNAATPAKTIDGNNTTVTVADIDGEIERLRSKEQRSKQIDENKIWDNLKKHFNPFNNVPLLKSALNSLEKRTIALAMYNKLSYSGQQDFRKLFDIDNKKNNTGELIAFPEVDETTFNQMCRFFLLDVLPPITLYSGYTPNALASLEVAKMYFPSVLTQIEQESAEKSSKREKKVSQRITELQAKKKELKKQANPKTTKSAK